MGLLDSADTTVNIKLYYEEKKTQGGANRYVILPDEDAEKMMEDEKKKERVSILNTVWKTLDWAGQNNITKESLYFDINQNSQDIDYFKYRDLRIKKCLIKWDLKDKGGQEIPVKPEIIDKLPADIVFALVGKYDKSVLPDEEEEKKT